MTIQTEIDRLIADLKSRGFEPVQIASELGIAAQALAFNIPLDIVRTGDEAAINQAISLNIATDRI